MNHWKTHQGACTNCLHEVDSDLLHTCRYPGCESRLCECCWDRHTFLCAVCRRRFCLDHAVKVGDEQYCTACAEKEIPLIAELRARLDTVRAHLDTCGDVLIRESARIA